MAQLNFSISASIVAVDTYGQTSQGFRIQISFDLSLGASEW